LLDADDRAGIDAWVMQALRNTAGPAPMPSRHRGRDDKALAEGTEAFAAERMNHGIRKALAGRAVDTI
jgi:molecular chaperone HscA